MSAYDIEPAGVRKALLATVGSAKDLGTAIEPLDGAIGDALASCGKSALIGGALGELMMAESGRLKAMGQRIEACVKGAADATNIYVRHDQQMGHDIRAREAQVVAQTRKLTR